MHSKEEWRYHQEGINQRRRRRRRGRGRRRGGRDKMIERA
jgi:hypothetical protein